MSLYLNLQPNQHGRDSFEPFLRKELAERVKTYGAEGPERQSLEQDAEKIRAYVGDLEKSANGLAIFASSGAGLFEAITLAAPVAEHRLYISDQPHVYPLAHLIDAYPRYALLLADTNAARIFVIAGNAIEQTEEIRSQKTKHHKMGGWSQARYQRHVENYHLLHAKEVIDTLARIVRDEAIPSVLVAGDDVIVPLLEDQMPKDLAERVIDFMKLDIRTPDHEILKAAVAAMREKDAETDRERVEALLGTYRANGLAVVGLENTKKALELGQVDELVVGNERDGDELIIKARQSAAKIRFIEDPALLQPAGGVGAFLRFKL
jgi:peptide chain release factor subunit 1